MIKIGNVGKTGNVMMISLNNNNNKYNLINQGMLNELKRAFGEINENDSCHVLILSGGENGKYFSSGVDVEEMSKKSTLNIEKYLTGFQEIFSNFEKPIIAAVSGFALGGGCELAMACDMIIAGENAKFSQPEIKLGIIPGLGGTQRLTLAVGKYTAMELLLTGRHINAKEAKELGIQ